MHQKSTITGRMTAEQIGLQTLWALLQGSPLAIFAVDQEASILVWNHAAERLFGWTEQETMGQPNPIVLEDQKEELQLLRDHAIAGEVYTATPT